jgi:NADP-dependent 3-hydroxy acid dehydrogenase YdfG
LRHPFAVDVTDERAVAEAVQRIEAELGPVERVMNADAIMPTDRILDQDAALVRRIMDINYGGEGIQPATEAKFTRSPRPRWSMPGSTS